MDHPGRGRRVGHACGKAPQEADSPAATERPAATQSPEVAGSAATLQHQRSERATLFIRTQENDIVRLRFDSRESSSLAATHATAGESEATELSFATRSSSRLTIKVDGDLNDEELAAIRSAVDQAVEVADDFFGGDVQAAFEEAAALDIDGEQLASVRMKMRVRESLTYSEYHRGSVPSTASAAADEPSADAAPQPTAETPEAAASTPQATPAGEAAPTTPSAEVEGAAPTQSEAPSDSVETPEAAAEVEPEPETGPSVLGTIDSFLDRLFDTLGASGSGGSLHMSLKLRIVQSTLVTLSEAKAEPVPDLVPDTIEALADQEQQPEPVDLVA